MADDDTVALLPDKAWWDFHAKRSRDFAKSFWYDCTVHCPPFGMDALEAMRQLHRDMQSWLVEDKNIPASAVEFWDAQEALRKNRTYGTTVLAQVAWLNKNKGRKDWPAILMQGRSFSGSNFQHEGKRYFIDAADSYVLSMRCSEG